MKKLILILVVMMMAIPSYAIIDKYTIDREQLPEAAQEMLNTYFPKSKVAMIKIDKHLLKKTDYDVKLVNGNKIEFSNKGKWTSVDCGSKAVPEGLVPKAITRYVSKNYAGNNGVKIVKIKKTTSAYEVGLSDGILLKFNLLGQFKEVITIDD